MSDFNVSLMFSMSQITKQFKVSFFKNIQRNYPALMPRKFGTYEPLVNVFSGNDNEIIDFDWDDMFIWKSKEKTVEAFWSINERNKYSTLSVYGNQKYFNEKFMNVAKELIEKNEIIIGSIHILDKTEIEAYKNYADQMLNPLNSGFTFHDLKVAIPNLPWGLFLGQKYIDLIGLERILSCPAYLVKQIENGIYLQVTENINDTVNDYPAFESKRAEIKKHLGERYFFNPDFCKSDYLAPDFGM